MKIILKILAVITIILTLSFTVFADTGGSGNLDGGGGSMGNGNSQSYWNIGNEGVRVTVVKAENHNIVTVPIDFTNLTINATSRVNSKTLYHFDKTSKLSYSQGFQINAIKGNYVSYKVKEPIPKIISTGDFNNIEQIKKYFCSEYIIKRISEITGMNYDVLIGGDYKLLIEPIAYITFQDVDIAMTATEAALYDEIVNGQLRYWMKTLTHQNLPLSMFLEVSDLGYPAWNGSTNSIATNSQIISSLGLGIVRFEEEPEEPKDKTYDYEYRVNTEVITSVDISGGQSDPDNPVSVQFEIEGKIYNVGNVFYPNGDSQLAWVKWTTPSEPQDMVINVTASGGNPSKSTLNIKIVDLDLNPPPNPVADDRNDDFEHSDIPERTEQEKLTWTVWDPWWQEYWVDLGHWETDSWTDSEGNSHSSSYWVSNWQDLGWWEFDCDHFYATLSADMDIVTDSYNPTANGDTFKSGYGINQEVTSKVSSNQSTAVSKTPNAVSYFPEFGYETYWRLLERIKTGSSAEFEFKENVYSTYKNRTHFSPIWYPDGDYTVSTHLIDYWCPTGMLSANLTDTLTVKGNLWMDWWIGPKDNN